LFSILIVPVLAFVDDPTTATRIALIFSAALFLYASLFLIRDLELPGKYSFFGAIAVCLLASRWAGHVLSADLLLSGLYILGVAVLMRAYARQSTKIALIAGLILGLCYLAKPPGLLFAIGALLGSGVLFVLVTKELRYRTAMRIASTGILGVMIVSIPWMVVLSDHYGEPTWTKAGKNVEWAHGGSDKNWGWFQVPKEGRIAGWEDPSEIESRPVSPRTIAPPSKPENPKAGFIRHIAGNVTILSRQMISPAWFALIVSVVLAAVLHPGGRPRFLKDPWRMGAIFGVIVTVPYVFTWTSDERHFIVCYPLFLICALGLLAWADRRNLLEWTELGRYFRKAPAYFLLVVFAVGLWIPTLKAAYQRIGGVPPHSYAVARVIAEALSDRFGEVGPVACVSEKKGDLCLYTALHLEKPYYGRENTTDNIDFLQTHGAQIVISDRLLDDERLIYLDAVNETARSLDPDAEKIFVFGLTPGS
jgi:MFS family permease